MKTFSKYLSLFFLVSLVNSCTLSFDEWITPEEKKGFDEAITEESDIGRVSYQYADNTKRITDNVLEYIAKVESDSIIYFMESTPSEWLPKEGNCLAAGVSEFFPLGLCNRVTQVERTSGFYKVTTTGASLDDVYKYYDVKISCDVNPDFSAANEVVVKTDSGDVKQYMAYDYSFLDSKTRRRMAKTDLPVTTKSNARTRGTTDERDNVTGYAFDTRWKFPEEYIAYYTKQKMCLDAKGFEKFNWVEKLRNAVAAKMESVTKTAAYKQAVQQIADELKIPNISGYQIIPFAKGEYISTKHTKIEVDMNSQTGYRKVVQEDSGQTDWLLEIGIEVKNADGPNRLESQVDKFKGRLAAWVSKQLEKMSQKIGHDWYSEGKPKFFVPIPISPPLVTVEICLTLDINVDITLSGSLQWTDVEAKQRKTMVRKDDNSDYVESAPETLSEAKTLVPKFNAQGSATFKIEATLEAVFYFGKVIGVGVGAKVEGGIEVAVQSGNGLLGSNRIESHDNKKNYIKPFLRITPYLTAYVAGWKPTYDMTQFMVKLEKPVPFYPVVRTLTSKCEQYDSGSIKLLSKVSFLNKGLVMASHVDVVFIFYDHKPLLGDIASNRVLAMYEIFAWDLNITTDEMVKQGKEKFYTLGNYLDSKNFENGGNQETPKELYVLVGLCDKFSDPTEFIYVDVNTATKVEWTYTGVRPLSVTQIYGDDIVKYDEFCYTPGFSNYDYEKIVNDFNAHHFNELVRALTIDDMAMYSVLGQFQVMGGSELKKWGVRVEGRVGNKILFTEEVPMPNKGSGEYYLHYKFLSNFKQNTELSSPKQQMQVGMYPYYVRNDNYRQEDNITLPDTKMRFPIGKENTYILRSTHGVKEYMSGE